MISRIKIENFRSIKDFDFNPPQLCTLIGANNVGKSNILKALDVLLGEAYPTNRAFDRNDFYNFAQNEIKINIWFNPPSPTCRCKSKETKEYEDVRAKAFYFKAFYSDENQIDTSFDVEGINGRLYWGNNNIRKLSPFVYIHAGRDLRRQLSISEWTLLGKILKEADREFREGEKIGETELTQNELDLKKAMEEIVLPILKRPQKYQELESSLLKNLQDQTKDLLEEFTLELKPYTPLHYYKTLQILGKEWEKFFGVTEMGSGIQNLILLALFRTYAELEKENAILAIEEPEICLHPHAERQLYRIFRELTRSEEEDAGAQIFYTTHSSNFVDLSNYKEVVLVKKDKEHGTKVFKSDLELNNGNEREELKIITEFNQERNEVFFARRVLLVEGETEKHALPEVFKLKGRPIDENGISIVETGGKGNIPFFIRILSSMDIPWVAIYDTDSDFLLPKSKLENLRQLLGSQKIGVTQKRMLKRKLEKHKETVRKNQAIKNLGYEEQIFPFDPNFEGVCGLPSPREEWKKIRNARNKFREYTSYEDVPEELKNAVEKLLNLLELPFGLEAHHTEGLEDQDVPF